MTFVTFKLLATLALAATTVIGTAKAEERSVSPRAVVELFTSQGCSSCPPADTLLGDLVQRGDVIALSYHVDYWDYLGWRDTLASPENTELQNEYGKVFGLRSVYTPQAVINGRTHVNGAKRSAVAAAVDDLSRKGKGLTVELRATRKGDSIFIETGAGTAQSRKGRLVLVYFKGSKSVSIDRGENGGRTITYYNVVSDRQTAAMWHGKAMTVELPVSEMKKKGSCAVLLQAFGKDGLPGPILGATLIRSEDIAR